MRFYMEFVLNKLHVNRKNSIFTTRKILKYCVVSKGADNFKALEVFKITPLIPHAYASVFTFGKIKNKHYL